MVVYSIMKKIRNLCKNNLLQWAILVYAGVLIGCQTAKNGDELIYAQAYKNYQDQKYEDAHKGFVSLIEKYPRSVLLDDSLYWIVRIELRRQHSAEEALGAAESLLPLVLKVEELQKKSDKTKNENFEERMAAVHMLVADLFSIGGQFSKATTYLEALKPRYEKNPVFLNSLLRLYVDIDDCDKALTTTGQLININQPGLAGNRDIMEIITRYDLASYYQEERPNNIKRVLALYKDILERIEEWQKKATQPETEIFCSEIDRISKEAQDIIPKYEKAVEQQNAREQLAAKLQPVLDQYASAMVKKDTQALAEIMVKDSPLTESIIASWNKHRVKAASFLLVEVVLKNGKKAEASTIMKVTAEEEGKESALEGPKAVLFSLEEGIWKIERI